MTRFKDDFPLMYTTGKQCCMEGCREHRADFTEERLCHHHFNAIVAKAVGDSRSIEEIANSTKITSVTGVENLLDDNKVE